MNFHATLGNRASVRYGLAVAAVAAAGVLQLGLTAWFGSGLPDFVVFYPMVMAVALGAGFGPGALATALAALLVGGWIMPPAGSWQIAAPLDRVGLALFACSGMCMSLGGRLFRQRWNKAQAYDLEVKLRESQKAAQEALNHSLSLLRATLESTADGLLVIDEAGKIRDYNQRFVDLWQLPASVMMSGNDAEALQFVLDQLEEPERFLDKVKQLYAQPEASSSDVLAFKDGRNVERYSQPQWLDGRPVGRVWSFRDISERKRGEEKLRQSEALYRSVGESIDYGVWICAADGRNTYASESFLKMAGITQEHCSDFGWGDVLHPDDVAETIAAWQECVRTGGSWDREHRFRDKDGGWHHVLARGVPVRDDRGNIACWAGINLDITGLKQAAAEAAHLAAIVKSSEDAIISKDLSGIVTSWNAGAERIFGYPAAEMIGQPITTLIPAERLAEETLIFQKIRDGESVRQFETQRVRKNGEVFDVSVTVSPIKDAGGAVIGASKMARDITGRKRAAEELRKLNEELEARVRHRTAEVEAANRELEAFSYSVAHDLRAPLRTIDGFSRAVLQDYGPQLDAEGQEFLRLVREGCQRMSDLIDDLLKLSRLTRAPMQQEPVDLTALARRIADDLQRLAPERVVEYRIAGQLLTAGDPTLLEAALRNLIENAWKFTGRRAEAVIEVGVMEPTNGSEAGHSAPVFFVRDNGAGFDPKYAGKLFGVFQRLHRQEDFAGTGVGLATVQRILQRHGGRIWAESVEDQGATFYFNLNEEASTP